MIVGDARPQLNDFGDIYCVTCGVWRNNNDVARCIRQRNTAGKCLIHGL